MHHDYLGEMGRRRLVGVVIFLPPAGFDSKVVSIVTWRWSCGFPSEGVGRKQWFYSVSVWYLVGEMEVERSSVNLPQTDFAACVNPVCFI